MSAPHTLLVALMQLALFYQITLRRSTVCLFDVCFVVYRCGDQAVLPICRLPGGTCSIDGAKGRVTALSVARRLHVSSPHIVGRIDAARFILSDHLAPFNSLFV
jgi:hypothetical protein